ncbi:MAG: hypothetical protein E7585_04145 [Ruminococcaceae bacterium]|nr:hypothetical protein [Oscillospiraceae bacterium]
MKKIFVFFLVVFFSFSVLVTAFGYAQLSNTFTVRGRTSAIIQEGVFISNVTPLALSDATETVNGYAQRVLNTTVSLGDSTDASVSYHVEFFNNDTKDMAYNGMTYEENAYDNQSISFAVSDVLDGTVIPVGGTLSLTLTLSRRAEAAENGALCAVIGFQFGEVVVFEGDDGYFEPGENYKKLVGQIISNSNGYGLNDEHKGYVIHTEVKENGTLYSIDKVQGGNIDKMLDAMQSATANIDFLFQYVSDSEYIVYFFSRSDAIVGENTTVYKQFFHFNGTEWVAGSALLGHAPIKEIVRPKATAISILPADWVVGALPPKQ